MKQFVFSNLMVVMKKYSKSLRQSYKYYGPTEACDLTTRTLALEKE